MSLKIQKVGETDANGNVTFYEPYNTRVSSMGSTKSWNANQWEQAANMMSSTDNLAQANQSTEGSNLLSNGIKSTEKLGNTMNTDENLSNDLVINVVTREDGSALIRGLERGIYLIYSGYYKDGDVNRSYKPVLIVDRKNLRCPKMCVSIRRSQN